jgi:hypothetical protein
MNLPPRIAGVGSVAGGAQFSRGRFRTEPPLAQTEREEKNTTSKTDDQHLVLSSFYLSIKYWSANVGNKDRNKQAEDSKDQQRVTKETKTESKDQQRVTKETKTETSKQNTAKTSKEYPRASSIESQMCGVGPLGLRSTCSFNMFGWRLGE